MCISHMLVGKHVRQTLIDSVTNVSISCEIRMDLSDPSSDRSRLCSQVHFFPPLWPRKSHPDSELGLLEAPWETVGGVLEVQQASSHNLSITFRVFVTFLKLSSLKLLNSVCASSSLPLCGIQRRGQHGSREKCHQNVHIGYFGDVSHDVFHENTY